MARNNASTESQRRYIEMLAERYSMAELKSILAPAFAMNGNAFDPYSTLNKNLSRLTKTAASRCIDILNKKEGTA